MIKYEYFDRKQFLIIKYVGDVTKSSLILFLKFLLETENNSSMKEVLIDFRAANKIYSVSDLIEITEARKKNSKGFNKIETIFLVCNPKDTVISFLYSDYYKGFSDVSIFSTIAATVNHISVNVTNSELELMLASPKFEFSQ